MHPWVGQRRPSNLPEPRQPVPTFLWGRMKPMTHCFFPSVQLEASPTKSRFVICDRQASLCTDLQVHLQFGCLWSGVHKGTYRSLHDWGCALSHPGSTASLGPADPVILHFVRVFADVGPPWRVLVKFESISRKPVVSLI